MKLVIFVLVVIVGSLILSFQKQLASTTHEICSTLAPIRQREHATDKFANLDYYQMCLDNIRCSSPLVKCD